MNPDLDIEVSLDLAHVLFRGQKQGLDLTHVQKDLEVHVRVVYPDQDQNQDLNRITGVILEIVIVEDIILHQSQYLNLDPEQNLSLDLDQDQEVNPDANDLTVSKIKCQHCQGIIYILLNIYLYYIYFSNNNFK